MKALLLSLFTALAVSGCASRDSPAASSSAVSPECERIDCETVNRINAAARARGITVIWRNPPPKP
jgi:hypothetical protein